MSRILIISEQYLRDHVDISDSINSKSVITAIEEAQSFYLASVIGDKFLLELYSEIKQETLTTDNKYLVDTYIQPFLAAQAASVLANKINFRIGNLGVVKSEASTSPKQIVDYYTNLTGIALRRLTDYLCKHYSKYHQYLDGVEGIRAHLSASDETSIYLGGEVKVNYPVDWGLKGNR